MQPGAALVHTARVRERSYTVFIGETCNIMFMLPDVCVASLVHVRTQRQSSGSLRSECAHNYSYADAMSVQVHDGASNSHAPKALPGAGKTTSLPFAHKAYYTSCPSQNHTDPKAMANAGAAGQPAAAEQVAAVSGRSARAVALQQKCLSPADKAGDVLDITSTSDGDDVDQPLTQRVPKRRSGTQPAAKRSMAKRKRTASLQGVAKAIPRGSRGPAPSGRKGSHSGGGVNGNADEGRPRQQNSGSVKPASSSKPPWDACTPPPQQTAGADRCQPPDGCGPSSPDCPRLSTEIKQCCVSCGPCTSASTTSSA